MNLSALVVLGTAFVLSAVSTPFFARFAMSRGLVVRPRADRWSARTTPLLGGAGIAVAVLAALVVSLPNAPLSIAILAGASATFALGLVDDFHRLGPSIKLITEFFISAAMYLSGLRVEILGDGPLSFAVTMIWLVGLMNAVNLIDNMDGLAAGIAAITGLVLALVLLPTEPFAVDVAVATGGAALGFLVHNFFPARVFMGDAGSLFLGFLLASAALIHTAPGGLGDVTVAFLGRLAILAMPVFDTAFVMVSRRLAGRSVMTGGRDHTSHRLSALGLGDRGAVLVLYGVTTLLALLGVLMQYYTVPAIPSVLSAVVALVILASFLLRLDPYGTRTGR